MNKSQIRGIVTLSILFPAVIIPIIWMGAILLHSGMLGAIGGILCIPAIALGGWATYLHGEVLPGAPERTKRKPRALKGADNEDWIEFLEWKTGQEQ